MSIWHGDEERVGCIAHGTNSNLSYNPIVVLFYPDFVAEFAIELMGDGFATVAIITWYIIIFSLECYSIMAFFIRVATLILNQSKSKP